MHMSVTSCGGAMSGYGPGTPNGPADYGQPYGGPPQGYQQGYPQGPGYPPGFPAPPPRRPRSRLPLYIGLVAAVVVVMTAVVIVFTHVVSHSNAESDTTALYQKLGKPDGFSQQGDISWTGHNDMRATLTATKSGSSDPVQATTTWLSSVDKTDPPGQDAVAGYFTSPNGPQEIFADGYEPHSVSMRLSSNGDTYTIVVQIIY